MIDVGSCEVVAAWWETVPQGLGECKGHIQEKQPHQKESGQQRCFRKNLHHCEPNQRKGCRNEDDRDICLHRLRRVAAPSSGFFCLTKVHPCTIRVVGEGAAALATLNAGRLVAGLVQAVCFAAAFLLDGLSPLWWAAFGSLQHIAVPFFPR